MYIECSTPDICSFIGVSCNLYRSIGVTGVIIQNNEIINIIIIYQTTGQGAQVYRVPHPKALSGHIYEGMPPPDPLRTGTMKADHTMHTAIT